MAGRKLTRRQAWRIDKIQQERRRRLERRLAPDGGEKAQALGPEQAGLVVANYGAALEVEAEDGAVHHCRLRQNLETLVVGDRVAWQADGHGGGVVSALLPRRSLLARPGIAGGGHRPLAANIDQILIVLAPRPAYSTDLLDRYLAAAELTAITPLIVLNKVDLLDGESRAAAEADFAPYRTIGYRLIEASTVAQHGLDTLIAALKGKVSVFVGQSGVGKSSMVNAVLPGVESRTGELSGSSGLGRHTTSTSRLYHLPGGGDLIDSPGVRDFALEADSPEAVAEGFVEFRPLLGQCRFRDCRHDHEPGCALREAVEAGRIAPRRLASYHRIVSELRDR